MKVDRKILFIALLMLVNVSSLFGQSTQWEKIRDYSANNTLANSPHFVDVVTDSKGLLYAATRENVFLWDGSNWSTFATVSGDKYINTQGSVSGNLEINAIAVDGANNVYIGGLFNNVNNVATKHMAKWNAALKKWESYTDLIFEEYDGDIKYNMEMYFSGLAMIDDVLYAKSHYGHLYKYANNIWQRLTMDTTDAAILPSGYMRKDVGNNLYAIDVQKVTRWNATSSKWEYLGGDFDNQSTRIAFNKDGALYAYGNITKAGTTDVNYITRWTGTQWVNVGGLQNFIDADFLQGCLTMAFDQNNTMYAGVHPREGMSKIYQLNGTQWSAFETGLNQNDEACNLITFDPVNSYLYAFCGNGIYRLSTKLLTANTTTSQPVASLAPSSGRNFSGSASDAVSLNRSIATELSGGSAVTIEYWFKGTQLQSAFRLQNETNFFVAGWGATPVHLLSNEGFDNTLKIQTKTGGSVQDNQWHHIAVTWSKGTPNGFISYVDGEQIEAKNAGSAVLPTFSNANPMLGAYNNGSNLSELTNGQLARVRVWKVVRTAQEIKDNMAIDLPTNTANMLYQGNGNTLAPDVPTTTNTSSQSAASLAPLSGKIFNGTTDAVSLNTSIAAELNFSNEVTIEYWFKGTQLQSAFRLQSGTNFIVAGWGSVPVHLFSNQGFGNTLKIQTKTGGSVQDNQWHHIAVTWSIGMTNGFVSYVDGEQIEAKDAVNYYLPSFSGVNPMLGAFNNEGELSELTNGQLARVRVWKVARTIQEIKDNMGKDLPANTANMLYQSDGN